MNFYKMQATGNDFVLLDCMENEINYSMKLLAEFLCDRHFGVGADGILILEKGKETEYKMTIFNSDGSKAKMCGNGIRCVAKYIYEKKEKSSKNGKMEGKENIVKIETDSGIKEVKFNINTENTLDISVNMGIPEFDIKKLPVYYYEKYDGFVEIDNKKYYLVSMGNLHAVCFVEDLEKIDVAKIGKKVENYKYFPDGTNVEFVQILNKNEIKIKIWERGAGRTLSCGTGASASAIICKKEKNLYEEITVNVPGGILKVKYDDFVFLKGNAEFVYEGKIDF